MLPEIGLFALILALLLAFTQVILPPLGIWYQNLAWQQSARSLAYGQCFFIAIAFFILAYSFLSCDFSINYVWQNSNTQLPWPYRLAALWGAHEGSMLLWVFVLSIWMSAVAKFSKTVPLQFVATVLTILAWISIGFLLFILQTSNPFSRILPDIPLQGQDLNPLLQDPGLATHPPMLYMGYVGFSVAFAFAISALLSGRLNHEWARWTRPWTLAAWCFLTLGITLGSWWSYRVLGWGGWWFWDPVENASFMPWLSGTALVHSLMVTEKRGLFKSWTALLAIVTFSLSLIGTFLVRSGILNSVHSFAVDPARGAFILKFLALVIGSSLIIFAWRASHLTSSDRFSLLSRESFLFLNNIFLVVAMGTVLLGTLYPLALDALGYSKISVGLPYYNAVFVPLALPFLFLMGMGPWLLWRDTQFKVIYRPLMAALLIVIALLVLVPWICKYPKEIKAYAGLGLALWIIITTFANVLQRFNILKQSKMNIKKIPMSFWGMLFAHLGLAITVLGVTLTSEFSHETDIKMSPGDTVQVSHFNFLFNQLFLKQGPNYQSIQAEFDISKNQKRIATLYPEKRIFVHDHMSTSQADIHVGIFRDLYIVLGENLSQKQWVVRIYIKPFVRWIWYGGLLMVLGGFLALLDERYRMMKRLNIHA